MSDADEPVVLIAVSNPDLAFSYADWLDDRFEAVVAESAAEAIEELEAEPAYVLLDRRPGPGAGDAVLGELRAAETGARVAMLTAQEVELDHLALEAVAPYPQDRESFEALFASLQEEPGLEWAVRLYRPMAQRRSELTEQTIDRSLENHTEYQALTRKLEAQRDRIIHRLDRLAATGEPSPEPVQPNHADSDDLPADPGDEPFTFTEKFRQSDKGPWFWLRAGLVPFLVVLLLFGLLFAVSGTWPAVVGVGSDSMTPQIQPGDLIVITAPGRYAPAFAENGIVSYRSARTHDYRSFGTYGSVIVFQPPGAEGPPTIHRVRFAVEEGENWIDRANDTYLQDASCAASDHCPAPHAGYITKGDNNEHYDQSSGLAPPVKRDWVMGVAEYRLPIGDLLKLLWTGGSIGLIAPPASPAVNA
jgi:signal peptidase